MSRTHNTSIAKSRLGPPRFGRRENDPPGPVVTYKLDEDELRRLKERCPPVDEREKRQWLRQIEFRRAREAARAEIEKFEMKEGEEMSAMEICQPAGQVRPEAPLIPEEKPTPLECLERGLPLDKARRMRKEDLTPEAALKLLTAGVTTKKLGELYGMAPATAHRLVTLTFGLRYNKKQAWEAAGGAPGKKACPSPETGGAGPALEEALSGVACPVPDNAQARQIWSDISRLDGAFKVLDGLVEDLAKTVKYLEATLVAMREAALTRSDVEEIIADSGEITDIRNRLRFLEDSYYRHRHQTGAGKWSGKAET